MQCIQKNKQKTCTEVATQNKLLLYKNALTKKHQQTSPDYHSTTKIDQKTITKHQKTITKHHKTSKWYFWSNLVFAGLSHPHTHTAKFTSPWYLAQNAFQKLSQIVDQTSNYTLPPNAKLPALSSKIDLQRRFHRHPPNAKLPALSSKIDLQRRFHRHPPNAKLPALTSKTT